jgi:hypothetical protein
MTLTISDQSNLKSVVVAKSHFQSPHLGQTLWASTVSHDIRLSRLGRIAVPESRRMARFQE